MNYEIENFIDMLHRTHLDNAQTCYQAMHGPRGPSSISPITNLIFELFLLNSLYSVDWQTSCDRDQLVFFDTGRDGPSETKKQRELIRFCRERCKKMDPSILADAFSPLAGHLSGERSWMRVQSDERITMELGERFFRDIEQLATGAIERRLEPTKSTFEFIESCSYFTYLVRNNIFHGQKRLGEIYDRKHVRRLSIYDLFVRCVNSLFFLAMGRKEYGSVYAQHPMQIHCGDKLFEINVDEVSRLAFGRGQLKVGDAFLHWKLSQIDTFKPSKETPKGVLFYPSAGYDLLFPLIVGLPHCDEFHFFDQSVQYVSQKVIQNLSHFGVRSRDVVETCSDGKRCLEFDLFDVRRRIWLRREDNLNFLKEQTPIRFYFHRGDSSGEGGSAQNWDGVLLQELVARSDDRGILVISDGVPGGLDAEYGRQLNQISLPTFRDSNVYFVGLLSR